MSEDEAEWVAEEEIHSLEAEFWALKRRARETADTWKKSLMYSKRAITAGLSLTDYEEHQAFRDSIGARMNKQDADMDEAANWSQKGWGFENWEEGDGENRMDNVGGILADVQAFLVSIGRIADTEPVSPRQILNAKLVQLLQHDLYGEEKNDGGREG